MTLSGAREDSDLADTLQYAWTQTGGDTVTLSVPAAVETTFALRTGLTENAVLTFSLRVTDDGGLSLRTGLTENAVLTFSLRVTDDGGLSGEDDVTGTVSAGEERTGPDGIGPTSSTVVEGETVARTLTATDRCLPARSPRSG